MRASLPELSDRDVDFLLAGRAPGEGECEELAGFVAEVRAAYVRPAAEDEVGRRAGLLAATARSLADVPAPSGARAASSRPRPSRRRRLALGVAGLALTAPLLTAGLALAGVSLPSVARAPFEGVGIQLPNQANGDAAAQAQAVRDVIDQTPVGQRDCTFGQAVAAAASGGRVAADDPCSRGDGNAGSDHAGGAGDGADRSQAGLAHAPAGVPASPGGAAAAQAQFGQGTAEQQSTAGGQIGDQQAQTGQSAGQPSSPGADLGQTAAGTGQSIGQQEAAGGGQVAGGSPGGPP